MMGVNKFDITKDINLNPVELRRTLRTMQLTINQIINVIDELMEEPVVTDDDEEESVVVTPKDLKKLK